MKNLKQIMAYWASVMIFYIISFFDFFSFKSTCIILWVSFLIINILVGIFNELKKIYIGTIIVELQFIICGIIYMLVVSPKSKPATLTIADKIVSYCNLMLACFDKPNVLLAFITMLLPLTVLIGVGVKKLTKHNKTA